MNKSTISSIATELHELEFQLTSLITRECAHLIDTQFKPCHLIAAIL